MSQIDLEPNTSFKYIKNQVLTNRSGKILIKIIGTMNFNSGNLYCAKILKHYRDDWIGEFRDYHHAYIERNFTQKPSGFELWSGLNG